MNEQQLEALIRDLRGGVFGTNRIDLCHRAADALDSLARKQDRWGVHMTHCNFGEQRGYCKYGDEKNCPAMTSEHWMSDLMQAGIDASEAKPIDMILFCPNPACGLQHIDGPDDRKRCWKRGDRALTPYGVGTISRLSSGTGFTEAFFADLDLPPGQFAVNERDLVWPNEPHRSHLCHGCGHIWRPADVPTNGVASIKTQGTNDSPRVMGEEVAMLNGRWVSYDDMARNLRLLDVALNGEEGAAKMPGLVDILGQVEQIVRDLGVPLLHAVASSEQDAEDRGAEGTMDRWEQALSSPMPSPGVLGSARMELLYRRTEDLRKRFERATDLLLRS